MKSIVVSIAVAAGLMFAGSAMAFSAGSCKACHQVDKDSVGPSFKSVAEKYGDAKALAAVFKSGFKVEDRKMAQADAKWKGQAATMTGQYDSLIKKGGNEEAAATAIFDIVKAGKY
jgi:cytochrome c551/c552